MDTGNNNKISIRQLMVMFLISVASPLIRVIPRYTSEIAKNASWLMPVAVSIIFLILVVILNTLIGKNNSKSLEDVFSDVFGKVLGKIINIIYIIWIIIILATYLRYFADRMTSSIYVFTPNEFFIATMLILVYYTTRNKLKFFARYIEFFMLVFTLFLIVTFSISIQEIKIENLLPVTINDTINVFNSSVPMLGIVSYITFMFFLGDYVSNKQDFKKHFGKVTIAIFLSSLMVILLTVGIFGYKLTSILNLPFFAFFKNIKMLEIIERIESLLITFWIVTDYCIITTFTFIEMKLLKKTFNIKSSKQIIMPILFISYIVSLLIASNLMEMINFSKYIFLPTNIILGMIFPIILLIVGKIRKKI